MPRKDGKNLENKAAALVLQEVCAGYGKKIIVGPVSLKIPKGRITTLIGPNGAGKSTMLKSITGELSLLSGKILLFGRDMQTLSQREIASQVAAVLTERIHPELLTCRDIVAVGRYPYTGAFGLLTDEDEQKIDQALKDVHAEEIADRDFEQISDGQKQRILLARALCQEPDLLILDEPTSYLDIKYKLDLLTVLQEMTRSRGMTVVMSLHEIDLAQKVSDLVICVGNSGQLKAGTPEEIFRKDTIRDLYGMEHGYYDALFGTVEFREQGQKEKRPEVTVLSAGGRGVAVYRKLQKRKIAFSAGLLSEADVDYHLARELSTETVVIPAFHAADDEQIQRAEKVIDQSDYVIDAGVPEGMQIPAVLRQLESYAEKAGKCVKPEEFFRLAEK
ncbi:MAG: ABC transporter ATP-binding protein [Eubacterium sp.]